MYLMISYGTSDSFCTETEERPFQGLIQGNSAVSPGFILITILLIRCLYNKRLVHSLESPISKAMYYLASLTFVNDSEFNIMNNGEESIIDITNRAQLVLTIYQRNLIFTRGQLKLQTCY